MKRIPAAMPLAVPHTAASFHKTCLLTLDLENDCGGRVGALFDTITAETVHRLICFINSHAVPLTIFAAGKLFEVKDREIQLLEKQLHAVEFAIHSYSHPNCLNDYSGEIDRAVQAYTSFFGKQPSGYRAPQGRILPSDFASLAKHHFLYDASIIPSMRPGVYDNRNQPNMPFLMEESDIVEIPCTVFPYLRIPLSLGYIRLLGTPLTKALFRALPLPDVVVVTFHLHDIVPTAHSDQLGGFWRFFYRYNIDSGYPLLDYIIRTFKEHGYTFNVMKQCAREFKAAHESAAR